MSCGCGGHTQEGQTQERRPQGAGQVIAQARKAAGITRDVPTMATMCDACPSNRRDARGVQQCMGNAHRPGGSKGLGSLPVALMIMGQAICPLDRWPDADGRVRWAGVLWEGLPEPLRWWATLRTGRTRFWPGCGCVVWIKQHAPWVPLHLVPRVRERVFVPLAASVHGLMDVTAKGKLVRRRLRALTPRQWWLAPAWAAWWVWLVTTHQAQDTPAMDRMRRAAAWGVALALMVAAVVLGSVGGRL